MSKTEYSDQLHDLRGRTLGEYFSAVNRNEPRAEALGVRMKDGKVFIAAVLTYGNGHRTTALENLDVSLKAAYRVGIDQLSDQSADVVSVVFDTKDTDHPIITVNGVREIKPA